ncbi:MAG: flagellar FliJ family protein [Gammaproteobacteria bacterium]|nr:flagellar FliJ family protein [Gammaproteobacteria bacterium]MCP5202289.1 flagellar FliJ family protein [Gammaproteobacteria bacterium]
MTRAKRLERIVALAELKRRQASQQLADSRRAHDANLEKLAQFRDYHAEYARALGQVGVTTSVASLGDQRRFIEHIQRTIDALDRQTQKSAARCREDIQSWQRESHRRDALEGILDAARSAAARGEEQRQQREVDDRGRRGGDDD